MFWLFEFNIQVFQEYSPYLATCEVRRLSIGHANLGNSIQLDVINK